MAEPLEYESPRSGSPKSGLGIIGCMMCVLAFAFENWSMMFHWNALTKCIIPIPYLFGFACGIFAVIKNRSGVSGYAAIILNLLGLTLVVITFVNEA